MVECKHTKARVGSYSGTELYFTCPKCKQNLKRETTREEKRELKRLWKKSTKHSKNLHKIWYNFCKNFMEDGNPGSKYKFKGYEMMEKARKWAKKHPEVIISRVDDDHFCGSDLVLIPHMYRGDYMGTTVVYIPQCSGASPIEFFLYPSHSQYLRDALKTIRKLEKSKPEEGVKYSWPKFKWQ